MLPHTKRENDFAACNDCTKKNKVIHARFGLRACGKTQGKKGPRLERVWLKTNGLLALNLRRWAWSARLA